MSEGGRALYAGVELGGTNVVFGVGHADGTLLDRRQMSTLDPDTTLRGIARGLDELAGRFGPARGLGIATFGPVRLDPTARDYGSIGRTPKTAWRDVNVLQELGSRFGGPVDIQTDVIGAAIGEATWGAGRGRDPFVYITVGTGIGAGVLVHGRPITGLLHPEAGHLRAPRAPGDAYPGGCEFHRDCIEGLAAGPSIVARWGGRLEELDPDHPAYELIAHYLSHLVTDIVLCVAPRGIVLGGGVMTNLGLFPAIRAGVQRLLGGYLEVEELAERVGEFIVPPGLGPDAGVLGAIEVGRNAAEIGRAARDP